MSHHAIATFKQHVATRGYHLSDAEWTAVCQQFQSVSVDRGAVLLDSACVTQHLFFVSNGVAASIQTTPDGDQQIARFFERGHLCSNLTSAWHQQVSSDTLIAMSDFTGLRIPFAMFREEFMSDAPLSSYWRAMVLETLVFDKDLICAKTIRDVETRYRFLVDRYDNVVRTVPDKYIARFLGITPQGLSRFKKTLRELT
ncbi:MAG: Crp/Fnr family transcriptional regulator [Pseudomonadota bacterium]